MATIIVNKKKLFEALKQLNVGNKRLSKKSMGISCDFTFQAGIVMLNARTGVDINLECKTEGRGKFSVSLLYITDIIKNLKEEEVKITVKDGEISVGLLTINANTSY